MTDRNRVLARVDSDMDGMVLGLQELVRQPSVSATGEGIEECARLVCGMLERCGISAEILRLGGGAAPVVYGEVRSKANPGKTILFYNHYDVQPAGDASLWDNPPFSGVVKDGSVFGRGAADDKGELVTRVWAVKSFLDETGDVPCNVKFVVEGEEEAGSEHIDAYLARYQKKFSCDGVIWEFGYVDASDMPIISLGMKGLLFAELRASGPARDAHSSLAVLIENPAWRLVEAISSMRSADGTILIKDWYKEVAPLSGEDLRLLDREIFDEDSFKGEYNIASFVGDKTGLDAKKALAAGATCNIAGFSSGYAGEGTKTILPAGAIAKLDFRLVPNMDPKKQEERLRSHLRDGGFGDIEVSIFHVEAAARTDPSDPFVAYVKAAADAAFGGHTLNISSAGTGPMSQFMEHLGAPCIAVGSTHVFSRIHSPNEFARVDLLRNTAKCICHTMWNFGAGRASP